MLLVTTLYVIAMLALVFFFGFVIGDLRATRRWEKKYNELDKIWVELIGGTD